MRPAIAARTEAAVASLIELDLGDEFDPRAPAALVGSGLAPLCVPEDAGGLGASMTEAAEVLLALGAVDGSTALGFAMQAHVTGALREAAGVDDTIRTRVFRAVVDDGVLVNNAATEEGGGSPARGAIPGTTAAWSEGDGWRLTGEKTWTTWLPALGMVFVTARLPDADGGVPEVGTFLLDLRIAPAERGAGFEALGMRGSASGRLRLVDTSGALLLRRRADARDPRGPVPAAWFGAMVAATYLGVGEGARAEVVRWAIDRRPGDGSTAVADIPSVQLRLGRLDAELRAARLTLLAATRRWDEARDPADIGLAKHVATRAGVTATDEALRIAGGPGFLSGRLERAFRDARAGLINPPLEDVLLTGFGSALVDAARR